MYLGSSINDIKMFIFVLYIYCDRTREWRATSSRTRDLRHCQKPDLSLNFSIKLSARHEWACHSCMRFSQATKYEILPEIASQRPR